MVLQYKLLSEALFGVNPENIVVVVSHLPKFKVRPLLAVTCHAQSAADIARSANQGCACWML